MKNKKLFYAVIVMVALLCLGIGYAAVSKNLTINGTAKADAAGSDALVVKFTKSVVDKCTATISTDGLSATIETNSLKSVNETATATITIANTSNDLRAIITKVSAAFNSTDYDEYFSLTVTDPAGVILDAKTGTTTVTVTITLIKLPVSAISDAGFTIKLKAEAAELV
jgi:hypothetical protein